MTKVNWIPTGELRIVRGDGADRLEQAYTSSNTGHAEYRPIPIVDKDGNEVEDKAKGDAAKQAELKSPVKPDGRVEHPDGDNSKVKEADPNGQQKSGFFNRRGK